MPQAFSPRERYQNPVSSAGTSGSTSVVPVRLSKHVSSPPPGPTGSAARLPRTTSYCVAYVAADQVYVALSASAMTFSVSGGAVIVVPPLQEPPTHASPIVQGLPSLQAVPSAAEPSAGHAPDDPVQLSATSH